MKRKGFQELGCFWDCPASELGELWGQRSPRSREIFSIFTPVTAISHFLGAHKKLQIKPSKRRPAGRRFPWLGTPPRGRQLLPPASSGGCSAAGVGGRERAGSALVPTLLAGALADLGDGLLPAALGAQAGGAQLAAAGVGGAVAAAHRVAALAHAHGEGRGPAGCCPGFTLPPLAALHALHARRAVPPAGRAAPARLPLAPSAHRAAAARVSGLAQRAAQRGQRGAGGRHARAAGIRRGGRGEGQEQEQQSGRAEQQGALRPLHGGVAGRE